MKYFAYGSNMAHETIAKICGNDKYLGKARLDGYRLAFTRRTIKSDTGVSDIVIAPGFIVWGVLFEIDEECLFILDRKEGYGTAYTRILVNVTSRDVVHEAITYTVMKKEQNEIAPSDNYLTKLIDGARGYKLPTRYIEFLTSLASEDKACFRTGFLVKSTYLRKDAKGMPLVKLPVSFRKQYPKNRFCIISQDNKLCAARITHDKTIADDTCELDQNIRQVLGIRGRNIYGAFVHLYPSEEKLFPFALFSPRVLVLPLHRPSVNDSEKQICVLDERNIRILGVEQGDYLLIRNVIKDKDGKFRLQHLSRRVFEGTARTILRKRIEISYPRTTEFYLDLDGRLELGIAKDEVDIPVLLSADLGKLFISRLLYYGATLFLGLLALLPVVLGIVTAFGLPSIIGVIGGLMLALIVTLLLIIFDLRAKTQY